MGSWDVLSVSLALHFRSTLAFSSLKAFASQNILRSSLGWHHQAHLSEKETTAIMMKLLVTRMTWWVSGRGLAPKSRPWFWPSDCLRVLMLATMTSWTTITLGHLWAVPCVSLEWRGKVGWDMGWVHHSLVCTEVIPTRGLTPRDRQQAKKLIEFNKYYYWVPTEFHVLAGPQLPQIPLRSWHIFLCLTLCGGDFSYLHCHWVPLT
jgi:hypothetical protein